MKQPDYLIIGGGVIGLSIARELKRRNSGANILLVEKESGYGRHASGRNSGVLHAGFYYTADSLKAKWTRQGNQMLQEYCREHKLTLLNCGKLVVTQSSEQFPVVDELMKRAKANGVRLEKLTEAEAQKIEPKVKTTEWALYSPDTATVDPLEVLRRMFEQAESEGVQFKFNAQVLQKKSNGDLEFSDGSVISTGYVINSAGLQADNIAHWYGFGLPYSILPFKGLYLKSTYPENYIKTHIYPLPDIRYPFLGVHFTLQIGGKVKIGPTALPALWREQYGGVAGFSFREFLNISRDHMRLFFKSSADFKSMAKLELKKMNKGVMVNLASSMLQGVDRSHFSEWGRPGIRAQLVDKRTMKLVMDFLIEGDHQSIHVLNAVSPGFTCSLPFANHVCDVIGEKMKA